MNIYGLNPVFEALGAGRVREIRVAGRGGGRQQVLVARAREAGVPVRVVSEDTLDREARGGVHQGVAATCDERRAWTVDELVRDTGGPALLVVLDGVEDPHNLGAILRTADAAGVHGVIVQSRRSAALDGGVAKASAGALAHVRIAEVVNIARALEELKAAGVWTVGLAAEAGAPYDTVDLAGPTALVVGAEGTGLRRLVRETCDFLAAIPMTGRVGSLNVSVAAGVALFEAVRQRSGGARRPAGGKGQPARAHPSHGHEDP